MSEFSYFDKAGQGFSDDEIGLIEKALAANSIEEEERILALALYCLSAERKGKDFDKALKFMNEYFNLTTDETRPEFAYYLKFLLEALQSRKKELKKNRKAISLANKKNKNLKIRIEELEKTINNLKNLDIRLEKQRLGVE